MVSFLSFRIDDGTRLTMWRSSKAVQIITNILEMSCLHLSIDDELCATGQPHWLSGTFQQNHRIWTHAYKNRNYVEAFADGNES